MDPTKPVSYTDLSYGSCQQDVQELLQNFGIPMYWRQEGYDRVLWKYDLFVEGAPYNQTIYLHLDGRTIDCQVLIDVKFTPHWKTL
jgi:hypothetical protein